MRYVLVVLYSYLYFGYIGKLVDSAVTVCVDVLTAMYQQWRQCSHNIVTIFSVATTYDDMVVTVYNVDTVITM